MIGIRDLRADLAAHVRRAAAGEATVVSIGGQPAAVLAPLATSPVRGEAASEPHLSPLVAAGAVLPPRRTDGKLPAGTVSVWGAPRLDRLLAEIRG
jgi:antitoxin (DNA-binding transcriptional repressor) of toxin-antitoxin stability system